MHIGLMFLHLILGTKVCWTAWTSINEFTIRSWNKHRFHIHITYEAKYSLSENRLPWHSTCFFNNLSLVYFLSQNLHASVAFFDARCTIREMPCSLLLWHFSECFKYDFLYRNWPGHSVQLYILSSSGLDGSACSSIGNSCDAFLLENPLTYNISLWLKCQTTQFTYSVVFTSSSSSLTSAP